MMLQMAVAGLGAQVVDKLKLVVVAGLAYEDELAFGVGNAGVVTAGRCNAVNLSEHFKAEDIAVEIDHLLQVLNDHTRVIESRYQLTCPHYQVSHLSVDQRTASGNGRLVRERI